LQSASGFVIEARRQYYLITNWHVVAGRDRADHKQLDPSIEPYALKTSIHIHGGEGKKSSSLFMGMRKRKTFSLYDEGVPQWIESREKPLLDLVALPIQFDLTLELLSTNSPGVYMGASSSSKLSNYWMKISAIPISAIDTNVEYGPPDPVHIIGYPLGWTPDGPDRSSSAFWRTSFIASELYEPGATRSDIFFVDPCAPDGMTGSPVVGMKDDRMKLLGVYSDQSTAEFGANAGFVWGAGLLKDLINTS